VAVAAGTRVPLQLRPNRFDSTRVRWLRRGIWLLVIDRLSGTWMVLPEDQEPFLRLVGCWLSEIPESVRPSVLQLRRMLVDNGVGVSGSEGHFDELTTLIVKLTSGCNLACTYCYDFEPEERGSRIDLDGARKAIAEAIELVPRQLWVILHGGEPMLAWPRIEDLVQSAEELAVRAGKTVRFTGQTNMTRLTERIVRFSEQHDIAWGLSLDGPAHLHDAARVAHDGRGSYAMIERSLRVFPQFVRRSGVMSTITSINQDHLLEVARHVRDLGFPSWDWSLFQPIGRGVASAMTYELHVERVLRSWTQLFDAVESGEFDGFRVAPVTKYVENFISGPGANMCMRAQCGAGRDLMSLSADGTIEACDCLDRAGPLGNLGSISSSTLGEARTSARGNLIRSRDVGSTHCSDCLWYGVCGGTCMAHAGKVDAVWDLGCELAKLAFDRVSWSLCNGDRLAGYLQTLR
jgi:uncharacterized protein